MSWWTPARQSYAVNFLLNAGGLSPYGAAGLVSRWMNVESSGGPASVNPSSGAFGIGQWLGARKAGIAGNTNFDAQLSYVVQELSGPESRAGNVLRSATGPDTAATGASMYERAEGYNAGSGRDNYTNKTAAGISNVLANWQGVQPQINTDNADSNDSLSTGAAVGLGAGTALAIVGGLLLAYLLIDD